MSKEKGIVLTVLCSTLLASCASSTKPTDNLTISDNDKKDSFALNLVMLSGYSGLLSDSRYRKDFDTIVNAGAMATTLPSNLNISSFGAAGLGFAISAINGTYPVRENLSLVILQPIQDPQEVLQPDFLQKTIQTNLMVRIPDLNNKNEFKYFPSIPAALLKSNISQIKCKPFDSFLNPVHFTHQCQLPYLPWGESVRMPGVYEGDFFSAVMPNHPKGKYAVIFISTSGQIIAKPGAENVFEYKKGAFTNSVAILPFIAANDQGKHLVFLNGKATLI